MNALDPALYLQVAQLYTAYAEAVDAHDWERWMDCFVEDCCYRVVPRENHERGLPLATLSFESKNMLRDRVYGIRETLFHDPYYQRHVVGLPVLHGDDGQCLRSRANYAVFRTKLSELSTVYNVGRYEDEILRTPQGLRLRARTVVYDSEMIPNSLIYPI